MQVWPGGTEEREKLGGRILEDHIVKAAWEIIPERFPLVEALVRRIPCPQEWECLRFQGSGL